MKCSIDSEHESLSSIGMIGLGVMGRNLLLNMAEKGFSVAGYDRDHKQVQALAKDAKQGDTLNIHVFDDLKTFVYQLCLPRAITGMWTSQSAMELQVPTPTIDMAIAMRDMSMLADQRIKAYEIYQHAGDSDLLNVSKRADFITQLGRALYSAMIITYAQGMALLKAASTHYEYQLNSETIALLWRGGCIIRADLLNDISAAFTANPSLENVLLDTKLATKIMERQTDLRFCIATAIDLGVPLSGFMASLSYFDAYRSAQSPANLIQAQRDYFGAHTYERIDEKGSFHTEWQHA